jgi:hypothetical protein
MKKAENADMLTKAKEKYTAEIKENARLTEERDL